MYQKCALFGDQTTARKVLLTDDPSEQQMLGRFCSGYIDGIWGDARQAIAMLFPESEIDMYWTSLGVADEEVIALYHNHAVCERITVRSKRIWASSACPAESSRQMR